MVSSLSNLHAKPAASAVGFGRGFVSPPPASLPPTKVDTVLFGQTAKKPDFIVRTPAFPWLLDSAGYVKAGEVLKLIDIAGADPAFRHIVLNGKGGIVTALVDRTDFREPIRRWDWINLEVRKTQVWNKSMETQVNVYVENARKGQPQRRHVATSHLVFVGIDPVTRKTVALPEFTPKTKQEKELAHAADIRKANREKEGKIAPFIPITDEDNPVVTSHDMTNDDANVLNNVFGGVILDVMSAGGCAAAKRHIIDGTPVGVRMDRMSFVAPTFVGETVETKAVVTKAWNTSMEVQIEVEAVHPDTGARRHVANAYMVFVKLMGEDRNGNPELAQVPPWQPKTDAQKLRAEAAQTRREFRKQEQTEFEQSHLEAAIPKKPNVLARFLDWLVSWLERLKARIN